MATWAEYYEEHKEAMERSFNAAKKAIQVDDMEALAKLLRGGAKSGIPPFVPDEDEG